MSLRIACAEISMPVRPDGEQQGRLRLGDLHRQAGRQLPEQLGAPLVGSQAEQLQHRDEALGQQLAGHLPHLDAHPARGGGDAATPGRWPHRQNPR